MENLSMLYKLLRSGMVWSTQPQDSLHPAEQGLILDKPISDCLIDFRFILPDL